MLYNIAEECYSKKISILEGVNEFELIDDIIGLLLLSYGCCIIAYIYNLFFFVIFDF